MIKQNIPSDQAINVKLDSGAFMPERAHATDAGMDLRVPMGHNIRILPGHSAVINTGVHIQLPNGTYGKIESKSGLNVKYGVVSCGGVIDEGYSGAIVVKVYNLGEDVVYFKGGEKVAQLLICPVLYVDCIESKEIEAGERGENGFGSTGR